MKTALLALTGAFMISGAALADAANVKESYVAGAFSSVDDDWLRITVNRHGDCGEYGSSGYRRVDVLIARYNAIGEAIESGDDAEVESAAQAFAFWDGLDKDMDRWLSKQDEATKDIILHDLGLRIHWSH